MARAFVPPAQHGMKILNREAFKKTVSTLAMRVQAKHVGGLMKNLSRFFIIIFYLLITQLLLCVHSKFLSLLFSELLNQPRLRNVANSDQQDTKLILLRNDLKEEGKSRVKIIIKIVGKKVAR